MHNNAESEIIIFEGKNFNYSDLSQETLEWFEWYYSLSPEEQLATNSIPAELNTYDGTKAVDADVEESEC